MALPLTYARRRKLLVSKGTDVYSYDNIPIKLRVQVGYIIERGLGVYFDNHGSYSSTKFLYDRITVTLMRDMGVRKLVDRPDNPFADLIKWSCYGDCEIDDLITAYELCLQAIDDVVRKHWQSVSSGLGINPNQAIAEFNARMKEAGVGYQYVNGQIDRVDSFLIHSEVVVPAITLLADPAFATADDEFRQAYLAFREGRNEDAITNAVKSFESVLKIIGDQRKWEISQSDNASKIIKAAVDADFLPAYMDSGLNNLKGLLESVATIRNKSSAHGAGIIARDAPDHLVAYQLHQTAAAILFLTTQHRAMPLPS